MEKQGSNCPSIIQGLVRHLTLAYNRESMQRQQKKGRRCNHQQQQRGWLLLLLLLLVLVLVCRFCHTSCSPLPTYEEVTEQWEIVPSREIRGDMKGWVHDSVVEMLGEGGVVAVEKYCTLDYMNTRLQLLEEKKKISEALRIMPFLLVFKERLRKDYMAIFTIQYQKKNIRVEEVVDACGQILRGMWVVYSHHHTSFLSQVCPKFRARNLPRGKEFLVPPAINFSFRVKKGTANELEKYKKRPSHGELTESMYNLHLK